MIWTRKVSIFEIPVVEKNMKRLSVMFPPVVLVTVTLVLGLFGVMSYSIKPASASQKPALEPAKEPVKVGEGGFSNLKVGDTVGVKEVAGKFKITLDWRPAGSKVVDIGKDWIAVQDPGNMITRIPITSVYAIVDLSKTIEEKK